MQERASEIQILRTFSVSGIARSIVSSRLSHRPNCLAQLLSLLHDLTGPRRTELLASNGITSLLTPWLRLLVTT